MRMPQDFVDAINEAVLKINPNARRIAYGSMTLGSDFDEWVGVEAIVKYGFDPLPLDALKAFQAKFNEVRDELKSQLISSAVEIERRRMEGTLVSETIGDSKLPPIDVREFVKSLEKA